MKTIYALAKLYLGTENKEKAAQYITQGKATANKISLEEYIIKFHLLQLQLNKENIKEYLETVAIPFFEEKKDTEFLIYSNVLLSDYYSQNKQYKQAYFKIKNVLDMKGGI